MTEILWHSHTESETLSKEDMLISFLGFSHPSAKQKTDADLYTKWKKDPENDPFRVPPYTSISAVVERQGEQYSKTIVPSSNSIDEHVDRQLKSRGKIPGAVWNEAKQAARKVSRKILPLLLLLSLLMGIGYGENFKSDMEQQEKSLLTRQMRDEKLSSAERNRAELKLDLLCMNKEDIPPNHPFWKLIDFRKHPFYSTISKEDMNLNFDQAFDPHLFHYFSKAIPEYKILIISSTTGQYSPEYLFLQNNELHLWECSRGENFSNAYVEHYSLPQMNTDEFYASSPYIVENPPYKIRKYSTDLPEDVCNRIVKIFGAIEKIVEGRDETPVSWTELKKGDKEFFLHSQLMFSLLGQVYEFGLDDHIFARCLDGDYYAEDSLCYYLIQLNAALKDYIFSPGGSNSLESLNRINDLLRVLEEKIK